MTATVTFESVREGRHAVREALGEARDALRTVRDALREAEYITRGRKGLSQEEQSEALQAVIDKINDATAALPAAVSEATAALTTAAASAEAVRDLAAQRDFEAHQAEKPQPYEYDES